MTDTEDQLDRARARGRAYVRRVLTEECWTTSEFIDVTGHDEDHLRYVADREANYFYLEHEGEKYWPKFQLIEDTPLTPDNFDLVIALLRHRGHGSWEIYQFWTTCSPRWETKESNIDRLKRGLFNQVIWDARTYTDQGAT